MVKKAIGVPLALALAVFACAEVDEVEYQVDRSASACNQYYGIVAKCGIYATGSVIAAALTGGGAAAWGSTTVTACLVAEGVGSGGQFLSLAQACGESMIRPPPPCLGNMLTGNEAVGCSDDLALGCRSTILDRCGRMQQTFVDEHGLPIPTWVNSPCADAWSSSCENAYDNCIGQTIDNCSPSSGAAPSSWTCNANYFDATDGCDCECGAYDPDCDTDIWLYGCPSQAYTCSSSGHCESPSGTSGGG